MRGFSIQRLVDSLKLKKFSLLKFALISLLITYHLSLITFSAPVFAADPVPPAPCDQKGRDGTYVCPAAGIIQVQQLMTRLINISVTVAFMALTVWLIWGALKFFITSGGDPKALAQAWSSVTWAFMGLFFMVLAWLALKLIAAVTGADVTSYCLGFPPYCI